MLRRKPTAITITTEDIIAFEEERLRQQQRKENNNQQQNNLANSTGSSGIGGAFHPGSVTYDPNDELKPLPGDKARIVRTRDERIGLGRTG
ncbi:hypothetical protein AJ78_06014 [Emergomyces pasteurianus Ep9510]|uniref:Uncharacterized protein n=1 Tax=Emergomyces pasteurianus Ep9510 TaxID=1447872 RepID=A0A1J9PC57_9EURO|nr:hypothetical protein AJ78_06014 [Emergomyces pasteurianus Ep9510]